MTASSLDGIPGLGEARKKKLVQAMGGVNAVKKASLDDLRALTFLPGAVAEAIHEKFHPAVDATCGRAAASAGGTVAVRALTDSDDDMASMAAWLSDPRVLEWFHGRDKPYDLDDVHRRLLARASSPTTECNGCIIEHDGEPVGYIQFFRGRPVRAPSTASLPSDDLDRRVGVRHVHRRARRSGGRVSARRRCQPCSITCSSQQGSATRARSIRGSSTSEPSTCTRRSASGAVQGAARSRVPRGSGVGQLVDGSSMRSTIRSA